MSTITPAASVLLSRHAGSNEIFAVLRSKQLRFFGDFWAFPGGKRAAQDADFGEQQTRATACRELFEETGVLIARYADGSFPVQSVDLNSCRQALLAEKVTFGEVLKERSLTLRPDDFHLIGEITTPPFAPLRYATTFFVAHLPASQQALVWPGELEAGEWVGCGALLASWRVGGRLLTPPTAMIAETIGVDSADDAPRLLAPVLARMDAGKIPPIFFAPCVQLVPLKAAALPPSAYTNAFLVGNGPCYLIDPGAEDPAEQRRLFEILDEQQRPLTAIVLSHQHPDHIGAARICAERFHVPIWAHPRTAEMLSGRVRIDRQLNDGDQLELGPSPANGERWFLDVLHTPGHASGHLAFFDPAYGLLFAGDMISTMTSMVIAPPDGDLTQYLESLRRLRALPARLLLPSHGNASAQPQKWIDDAIEHRAKREKQLLDALRVGPGDVDELTEQLYRGTPEALMRFARAQTLAGLQKLEREGKAVAIEPSRWRATPSTSGD